MIKNLILYCLTFLFCGFIYTQTNEDYVKYVNPLIGTDTSFELSNGNTYPAIARPWGMNFWTPQTGKMGDGWAYTYKSDQLVGFKQTHQPSPWINDYGAFSLMPSVEKLSVLENDRKLKFNHENEIVEPHYYSVIFNEINTKVEFTVTERSSFFKFNFPKSENSNIIIDAFFKNSEIKVIPDENKIIGIAKNNSGGVPENFANYFVIEFNRPFKKSGVWDERGNIISKNELSGKHVGAYVSYDTTDNGLVEVKVSSSFISHEQAWINLNRELPKSKKFHDILAEGRKSWNNELSKIKVKAENTDYGLSNKIKFYSCFYRTILFPRQFHEYKVDGKQIHYSPYNGEILEGPLYTDNGFWDTFRAVFPFYSI